MALGSRERLAWWMRNATKDGSGNAAAYPGSWLWQTKLTWCQVQRPSHLLGMWGQSEPTASTSCRSGREQEESRGKGSLSHCDWWLGGLGQSWGQHPGNERTVGVLR